MHFTHTPKNAVREAAGYARIDLAAIRREVDQTQRAAALSPQRAALFARLLYSEALAELAVVLFERGAHGAVTFQTEQVEWFAGRFVNMIDSASYAQRKTAGEKPHQVPALHTKQWLLLEMPYASVHEEHAAWND